MAAEEDVFADPAVREAIALLRDKDVTAEQYASVELVEIWHFDGEDYPSREAAFAAAKTNARDSGQTAEVWRHYGDSITRAVSWLVRPDGTII